MATRLKVKKSLWIQLLSPFCLLMQFDSEGFTQNDIKHDVKPFKISISQEEITDLKERIASTR